MLTATNYNRNLVPEWTTDIAALFSLKLVSLSLVVPHTKLFSRGKDRFLNCLVFKNVCSFLISEE